jgi:ABC-type nitrate/sulfonate/bicarbonate transport system permease component
MFTVMLPASLPMILAGMRVSLGLGLILVVLAEMLTGSHGLGAQLVDAQRAFRVHEMYAWTVVLALVGLALALGFDALERRLIFWSSRR